MFRRARGDNVRLLVRKQCFQAAASGSISHMRQKIRECECVYEQGTAGLYGLSVLAQAPPTSKWGSVADPTRTLWLAYPAEPPRRETVGRPLRPRSGR